MRRGASGLLAVAALAAAGVLAWRPAPAQVGEYDQQQRGRYLVEAGDCAACHTAEGGATLAGGRPVETPFGTVYSPNLTPDPDTGIGTWSDEQFYRAMHDGVAADGSHLYPAFPYPWFTKVTREDVQDIRAYLRTLTPVKTSRPHNTLPWPLDDRAAMIGWNALYFQPGTYRPDAGKSAEWNRGAYLVEGLAHCGACHSPKNVFGAVEGSKRYQGAEIQHWYSIDLTGNPRGGLGSWSQEDIAHYLKTGHIDRTVAYGPMAEVVGISTSHLTDADLMAIATYLKSLPSSPAETPDRPAQDVAEAGQAIYADSCSACHRQHGEGVAGLFPALKGDTVVQSTQPTTVIRLILNGGHAVSVAAAPTPVSMPSFDWKLSDAQIAAVTSYIRSAWGNAAPPVSAGQVTDLRRAVRNASTAD